jgi:hypothetical protein
LVTQRWPHENRRKWKVHKAEMKMNHILLINSGDLIARSVGQLCGQSTRTCTPSCILGWVARYCHLAPRQSIHVTPSVSFSSSPESGITPCSSSAILSVTRKGVVHARSCREQRFWSAARQWDRIISRNQPQEQESAMAAACLHACR